MLAATRKKQVHEAEHLPKFGVTSMDIFIQVNTNFLLQLVFPTPAQANLKVNISSLFYFHFEISHYYLI